MNSSLLKSGQILGVGTIVVDHQLMVDHYPSADTKIEARDSRIQVGGPVPTALALLSRFGHSCHFAGLWGADFHGTILEADLHREKISFSPECRREELSTGVAQVWVDQSTGSRTIVCQRSDVSAEAQTLLASAGMTDAVVHLDGWPCDAAINIAQKAKANQQLVCLDTGSPKGRTDELLKLVDVVNAPRRFLTQHFEEDDLETGAKRILESGPRLVSITDGDRGAWLFSQTGHCYQPAFPINTVDTTGAGDVFSAGLLHAVIQDWNLEQAAAFASAAAALKCQQIGNRNALPTLDQIEQFLQRHH